MAGAGGASLDPDGRENEQIISSPPGIQIMAGGPAVMAEPPTLRLQTSVDRIRETESGFCQERNMIFAKKC